MCASQLSIFIAQVSKVCISKTNCDPKINTMYHNYTFDKDVNV